MKPALSLKVGQSIFGRRHLSSCFFVRITFKSITFRSLNILYFTLVKIFLKLHVIVISDVCISVFKHHRNIASSSEVMNFKPSQKKIFFSFFIYFFFFERTLMNKNCKILASQILNV